MGLGAASSGARSSSGSSTSPAIRRMDMIPVATLHLWIVIIAGPAGKERQFGANRRRQRWLISAPFRIPLQSASAGRKMREKRYRTNRTSVAEVVCGQLAVMPETGRTQERGVGEEVVGTGRTG